MAGALKGITIELGGNATKLGDSLKSIQAQATATQKELRGLNTMLKVDPSNATLIAQKYTVLGEAIAASKTKLAQLKQTQADIDSGKVKATADQYRDLEREIEMTQQRIASLTREQAQYASTSAVQMQAIGKQWQEQGKSITEFGQKMMPLTVAIAAVGAAGVVAAVKFESSFAGVKKTVNATAEEFDKLAEASRNMALNKPVDVNDVNRIMELGGQLGIATENLEGFASVVSDLDVATDLDVDTASTEIAQFSNITGMAQSDADRFGASLVALGNSSATTESAIMDMAMRIAGAGSQVGMSQAQILGLSASLSSVGINAEAGGTAISTLMSGIDKDIALNSDNIKTWAAVAGMSVDQFKTAWGQDAVGALEAVFKGMGDASKGGENLNVILENLGITSIRQTDMVKRLASASDLLATSVDTSTTAWSENTALTNEASQRYQTTESQLLIMKNRIVDAGISIGQGLQPALLSLLKGITPVVEGIGSLATGFKDMNPAAQSIVTTLAGMAAGFAPVVIISGKLMSLFGTLVATLGKVSAAFAAKAAAATLDTAATTANDAATKKSIISQGILDLKKNIAAATAARKGVATTAETVATVANTAATEANATATTASGTASIFTAAKTAILTVAQGAQAAASNAATIAQVAWNAAMAANPIGTVIMAVGALVAVVAGLGAALNNATDDTDDYTASTQANKKAVDDAQAAYDEACKSQGANSDAAIEAKAALDDEKASFEESKQTVAQFCDEIDKAVDSHNELMGSIDESTDTANTNAGAILNMSQKVAGLVDSNGNCTGSAAELQAAIGALNESCEGLNVTYDANTNKLNMNVDAIKAAAKAEADRIRSEDAMKSYNELIKDEADLTDKMAQAKKEATAAGLDLSAATEEEMYASTLNTEASGSGVVVSSNLTQKQAELADAYYNSKDALDENKKKQDEALQTVAQYTTKQAALKSAMKAVEDGTMTAEEAATRYSEAVEGGITADEIREAQAAATAEAEAKKATATAEATSSLQDYISENSGFGQILADNGYSVEGFAAKLVEAGVSVDDFTNKVDDFASQSQDAFNKIEQNSDASLDSMLETLQYNTQATSNWASNITELYGKAGTDSERQFIDYISSMGVEYAPVVQQLLDDTSGKLPELAQAWADGGDAAKIAALAEMGLLKDGMVTETGQLTEEAKQVLAEAAPEMADSGTEGGQGYSESLQNAIASCPAEVQKYIQDLKNALNDAGVDVSDIGTSTGTDYSSNLSDAISQCPAEVQTYIQQLKDALTNAGVDVSTIGTNTGTDYGEGVSSGIDGQSGSVGSSASGLKDSAENATSGMGTSGLSTGTAFTLNMANSMNSNGGKVSGAAAGLQSGAQNGVAGMGGIGSNAGTGFGSNMQGGINGYRGGVGSAASGLQGAASGNVSGMGRIGSSAGSLLGSSMAGGINGQNGSVGGAASGLANASQNAKNYGDPYSWGSDLGSQLSSGIRSTIGTVRDAASALAAKVAEFLHFSVPDSGPLADFDTYMPDMTDLMASGIKKGTPTVAAAAAKLAQATSDELNGIQSSFSPDLTGFENGVRSTFGVDIDKASLDAIQLNAANTEAKLSAVITTLQAMTDKLQPDYKVVLDTGVLAGSMTKKIDKNLGTLQRRRDGGLC